MSNRRIVEQLILRMKCAPETASVRAQIATELTQWMRNHTLIENIGSEPTAWGHRYDLTLGQGQIVLMRGAGIGLADARRCTFYQHRSRPSDERILEEALRLAINDPAWPGLPPGNDWGKTVEIRQFTPAFMLRRWPKWLIDLLYLIALTRREWAYVALCGGRTNSPDWRESLAEAWYGTRGTYHAVYHAAHELEDIAYELQGAQNRSLQGSVSVEETLPGLKASFAGALAPAAFVGRIREWLQNANLDDSQLGLALQGLRQMLAFPPDPLPALHGLLSVSSLSGLWTTPTVADLINWLSGLRQSPLAWFARYFTAWVPAAESDGVVVSRILLGPGLTPQGDAVLSREDLQSCLAERFAGRQPYEAVLGGLFFGMTIDDLSGALGAALTLSDFQRNWVSAALLRAQCWRAAPPIAAVNPNGWDFSPELAKGTTLPGLQAAIGWLENVQAAWPSPGWNSLCNLLLSLCLEEITVTMQNCYRSARRGSG